MIGRQWGKVFNQPESRIWVGDPRLEEERSRTKFGFTLNLRRSVGIRLRMSSVGNWNHNRPSPDSWQSWGNLGQLPDEKKWVVYFAVPKWQRYGNTCGSKLQRKYQTVSRNWKQNSEVLERSQLYGCPISYSNPAKQTPWNQNQLSKQVVTKLASENGQFSQKVHYNRDLSESAEQLTRKHSQVIQTLWNLIIQLIEGV